MGTILLFAVFLIILAYFIFREKGKSKGSPLPSGPPGIPYFGNLFQFEILQHITYAKWAKEFGDIFTINVAGTQNIVVSDHELLKEMFAELAFSGRADFRLFDVIGDGNIHGIVNTDGKDWEELRKFSLRQLRDFGFGKKSMEESLMTEVKEFIESLREMDGRSTSNIHERLLIAVVNTLWTIVTGKGHKQNDPEINAMASDILQMGVEDAENGSLLLLLAPRLAQLFPNFSGYNKIKKNIDRFAAYFKKPLEEHKKSYSQDYDRDFIDVYLREIRATKDEKSPFYGTLGGKGINKKKQSILWFLNFSENHLHAILGELYVAGSETTSSTLSFMVLYLSKFPEIQKKLQEEIKLITGNSRSCYLKDRPNMPYAEAVLAETLRFSTIFPQGLPHRVMCDQEFKGYRIPKDAIITQNLYYIHHDPKVWGDPENFRPERFLSVDGTTFVKNEALLPFSTGRRQCLGETLARNTLFLFATNVFQRFWFEFDKDGPDHGFEPKLTFILCPKPFNVIIKDRLG